MMLVALPPPLIHRPTVVVSSVAMAGTRLVPSQRAWLLSPDGGLLEKRRPSMGSLVKPWKIMPPSGLTARVPVFPLSLHQYEVGTDVRGLKARVLKATGASEGDHAARWPATQQRAMKPRKSPNQCNMSWSHAAASMNR